MKWDARTQSRLRKLNFAAISIAALRAYVLNHRMDDKAFYALVDRVHIESIELQPLKHLTELIKLK
jgi:hypothetical protein